jgi:predicted HTH domain antitoxin
MNVTLQIPDDIVLRLGCSLADISRRALEALAVEEYRAGRLTLAELRRLLDFETRAELDGFLKARAVYEDYAVDDLEREREALRRLGI